MNVSTELIRAVQNQQAGTGLGLAIVKHIVAKHPNAELKLESEVGKGTTIRVVFN